MSQNNIPKPYPSWNIFRMVRSLQTSILVSFSTLIIITVSIIIWYLFQQNRTAVLTLSDSLISQTAETITERTINHLSPAADMASISAQMPHAPNFFLTTDDTLEQYGIDLLTKHPEFSGFFIGNEQGEFLFIKRFPDGTLGTKKIERDDAQINSYWTYRDLAGKIIRTEQLPDDSYDPRLRPWYKGAAASKDLFWTDSYIFFTDQKPGITAAYPILSDDGTVKGVIGIDVALDDLSRFLASQEVSEHGLVLILNAQGEIIAYPDLERSLASLDADGGYRPLQISELPQTAVIKAYTEWVKNKRTRFTFELEEKRYLAAFQPFPSDFEKDWQIVIVVPEEDFIGPIIAANAKTVKLAFYILTISIILAIFLSRSIAEPIKQLTEETYNIKQFKLDNNLLIRSPIREVQQLNEAIDSMKIGLRSFKKYVPAALVRQLIETGQDAQIGGTEEILSVMFTDIAGFTTISEKMKPELLLEQLAQYMGSLATAVHSEKGTIDKFIGDGMMAFWGAPIHYPDHAALACQTALKCQNVVKLLNKQWQASDKPAFITRISVHSGNCLVGNIGSDKRMNYTILGDTVNLASRLEAVNSLYGTEIVVSQDTYELTQTEFFFRPLDIVQVKGKSEGVLIYELMGEKGTDAAREEMAKQFLHAFKQYGRKEWEGALQNLLTLQKQFPEDNLIQIYINRCRRLIQTPPASDWSPHVDLQPLQAKIRHGTKKQSPFF